MLQRTDLPLLLAAGELRTPAETEPLDRLRLQKAVFLVEQRGPAEWRGLYDYEPYDWGPYSSLLQSDVRALLIAGEMDKEEWPNRRYGGYRTGTAGQARVAVLLQEIDAEHLEFLRSVRRFVTTRSFRQLLRDVYSAFPNYAVNSRFSG